MTQVDSFSWDMFDHQIISENIRTPDQNNIDSYSPI